MNTPLDNRSETHNINIVSAITYYRKLLPIISLL